MPGPAAGAMLGNADTVSRDTDLAALYGAVVPKSVRLAYLLTSDLALAEDVAQDAFIRVASKLGQLRDPNAVAAYLRRAVVNEVLGRRRSLARQARREEADNRARREAAPSGAEPDDMVRDSGFRTHGKSKDHRDDLPQVVIGMAVTRTGIPVRVWSWPGNYSDSALIRHLKDDMRDWSLARVIWVADRGFSSDQNRRYLQRGGGHYIIGEKLRSGSAEATAALSRQGRYAQIAANLQVKEVKLDDAGDRFVICFNPDQAERDQHVREYLVARLTDKITGSDTLSDTKRAELHGQISTQPGLNRFLRVTPGGLLRVDQAKIKADARLDGKYLLRCSDPKLGAEDIALGYKQLLEVERGWRDMKSVLDLRPVHHRLEQRIRTHVLLCWLALLLARVAETRTGRAWPKIRAELDRLHAVTFTGSAGTFRQTTELTKAQRDLLTALSLDPPKKIIELAATL
jgi:hypothetical protein